MATCNCIKLREDVFCLSMVIARLVEDHKLSIKEERTLVGAGEYCMADSKFAIEGVPGYLPEDLARNIIERVKVSGNV